MKPQHPPRCVSPENVERLIQALKAAYQELANVDALRAVQADGRSIGEHIDHALEAFDE